MMPGYAEALSNFAPLVDHKTGLIRSVELLKISEVDPAVFLAYAVPCDTTPLAGIPGANRGGACSVRPERAVVRACGESIERYCSAFCAEETLRLAPERQLTEQGARCVRVSDIYPFADWQYALPGFPYQQVNESTAIRWIEGCSAISKQAVWVPASCVYVPYRFELSVEPFTHMPISTGLAAGPTVDDCIRKGIFETLERDALMIVWYARLPAPRIAPATCRGLSEEVDQLLSVAGTCGAAWHLNWLTLDVDVPVISAALIDPGAPPLTSFGIAADTDPRRALLLALEEAVLSRFLLNRTSATVTPPEGAEPAPDAIRTLRDHLLAHATSLALRERSRFLTDNPRVLDFAALVSVMERKAALPLLERLAEAGLDAIWVEVTTPDVQDVGIHVVRTIVPGLQPLDNDHRYRYLGGRRLLSVPRRLGYPIDLDQLNPDPHPFP
jgi:ribosomal protein S12 methylthiotransferase accessory factor